ncbi:MAG: hypothetical protein D6785_14495, partial [Planctomycetota bacterium]
MNLLQPSFLWFGLLALPIIGLYLLRFKRKDQIVSSVLIWERVFKRKAITAFWQRLRRIISLLLHLAILCLLTFALTRPLVSPKEVGPRCIAIILDNS